MAELTPEEKAAKDVADKTAKDAADAEKKAKADTQKAFDAEAKKPGRYIVGDNLVDPNGVVIMAVPQ